MKYFFYFPFFSRFEPFFMFFLIIIFDVFVLNPTFVLNSGSSGRPSGYRTPNQNHCDTALILCYHPPIGSSTVMYVQDLIAQYNLKSPKSYDGGAAPPILLQTRVPLLSENISTSVFICIFQNPKVNHYFGRVWAFGRAAGGNVVLFCI